MPRAAYIFLKNSLLLCCLMLGSSLLLFVSLSGNAAQFEKMKMATYLLEAPAGLLLLTVLGLALILDRS